MNSESKIITTNISFHIHKFLRNIYSNHLFFYKAVKLLLDNRSHHIFKWQIINFRKAYQFYFKHRCFSWFPKICNVIFTLYIVTVLMNKLNSFIIHSDNFNFLLENAYAKCTGGIPEWVTMYCCNQRGTCHPS